MLTFSERIGNGLTHSGISLEELCSAQPQVILLTKSQCKDIELETGMITFENGKTVQHEAIIGADGIGSAVRKILGIKVDKKPASSGCLHTNVDTAQAVSMGLVDYSKNSGIEFWGGHESKAKIVLSPCNGGSLLSYYCFFERPEGDVQQEMRWDSEASVEELLAPYPDLDDQVKNHLKIGVEIRPWRLWVHQPYSHWQKGTACIMGDAAHPMMPVSKVVHVY